MPSKTNLDAMLAAAKQEVENKESFALLEKMAELIRDANLFLESFKTEIASDKEDLKMMKEYYHEGLQNLGKINLALNAAAASCDNIVGGITHAIVDAEQSTVHVGIKDGDMEKLGEKLTEYLGKVQKITVDATNSQVQEFQSQRRNACNQYKEWDGIWFGRYSQWFFMFFYTLGFGATALMVVWAIVNTR